MPVSYADPWAAGVLVGTAIATIILFDLADIRPQVGSFSFLKTSTYAVYFLIQLLLALIAAFLVASAQPNQPAAVVGFLSVVTGVVLLQGFALNVAGADVLNVSQLMKNYKTKMIEFEVNQNAVKASVLAKADADLKQATVLEVTTQLCDLDEDELVSELQAVLLQTFKGLEANPAAKVQEVMAQWIQDSGDNPVFRRQIFAHNIAASNIEFAKAVLKRRRPDSIGSYSSKS